MTSTTTISNEMDEMRYEKTIQVTGTSKPLMDDRNCITSNGSKTSFCLWYMEIGKPIISKTDARTPTE